MAKKRSDKSSSSLSGNFKEAIGWIVSGVIILIISAVKIAAGSPIINSAAQSLAWTATICGILISFYCVIQGIVLFFDSSNA